MDTMSVRASRDQWYELVTYFDERPEEQEPAVIHVIRRERRERAELFG